jgi:hypothetical protein
MTLYFSPDISKLDEIGPTLSLSVQHGLVEVQVPHTVTHLDELNPNT